MHLTVNGEKKTLPTVENVAALLAYLELPLGRVAVEHNGVIVQKEQREGRALHDGDVLEIVTLVGGG